MPNWQTSSSSLEQVREDSLLMICSDRLTLRWLLACDLVMLLMMLKLLLIMLALHWNPCGDKDLWCSLIVLSLATWEDHVEGCLGLKLPGEVLAKNYSGVGITC